MPSGPGLATGRQSVVTTRVLCVVLSSLLSLGGSFARDVIAAVSPQIRQSFGLSHARYAFIASLQGLPNVVLAFITGAVVDSIGFRRASVAFTAMVAVGTMFVSLSASGGRVWMLVIGQLIIGIGKQVVSVAQKVALPQIAARHHMAISLGANLATNRIGFAFGWAISPFLIDEESGRCGKALFLSFALCFFSFVCGVGLFYLTRDQATPTDPKRKQLKKKNSNLTAISSPNGGATEGGGTNWQLGVVAVSPRGGAASGQNHLGDIEGAGPAVQRKSPRPRATSALLKEVKAGGCIARLFGCLAWGRGIVKAILQFPRRFWLLTGTLVMYYSCFLPFKVIALEFLMDDRDLSETAADELISLIAIVPIFGCLLTGIAIDSTGRISEVLEIGMMVNILSLVILHKYGGHEVIGIILLGVADSLVCTAGWTLVPQVVKPHRRGLAVGLVHAIENSWDVPLNSVFGYLRDQTGSHHNTFQCMICLGIIGFGLSKAFGRVWRDGSAHKS
mmetsp:Transcript_8020/g.15692  ORF Transcript_8020/g.15692 Transcript_8020/m.15692 type:complete len:505 (-) Transcript_8020:412-1926(-)